MKPIDKIIIAYTHEIPAAKCLDVFKLKCLHASNPNTLTT